MKMTVQDILQEILIPRDSSWVIESVRVEDANESIYISLRYDSNFVTLAGKRLEIYDFRHERTWRHLDLWQYKTFITAQIPRYIVDGKVLSLEVPWAEPGERMTKLLEKKR